MTTDTLIDVSLEEAEAIMRAEWLRLQHDTASRERQFAEAPAARPRPTHVALLTTCSPRPARRPPPGSRQRSTRHRPKRVSPSQRSPPKRNHVRLPNVAETEVMP
jgi:hypothetical protein